MKDEGCASRPALDTAPPLSSTHIDHTCSGRQRGRPPACLRPGSGTLEAKSSRAPGARARAPGLTTCGSSARARTQRRRRRRPLRPSPPARSASAEPTSLLRARPPTARSLPHGRESFGPPAREPRRSRAGSSALEGRRRAPAPPRPPGPAFRGATWCWAARASLRTARTGSLSSRVLKINQSDLRRSEPNSRIKI